MIYGFIGAGNMGGALLRGYLKAGGASAADILITEKSAERRKALQAELGVGACESIAELVRKADVILLAVKPNLFEEVLPQAAEGYSPQKVVVTMAAGVSISFVESYLGKDAKVIRIMPNTPAMVGEAMTAVCRNGNVEDALFASIFRMFTSVGRAQEIPETLMDCVVGVSGSSPAYTYMYIDALADAAVKNGMPKQQAVAFAAQSALGAAKMVLETGVDPVQLRINVCSPGGTTIEAVETLQKNGFEKNIAAAFQAAVEKSKIMTK